MSKPNFETEGRRDTTRQETVQSPKLIEKSAWETPKMEDVSEQVMAQPYIRFT
jgi:hypothetical protein